MRCYVAGPLLIFCILLQSKNALSKTNSRIHRIAPVDASPSPDTNTTRENQPQPPLKESDIAAETVKGEKGHLYDAGNATKLVADYGSPTLNSQSVSPDKVLEIGQPGGGKVTEPGIDTTVPSANNQSASSIPVLETVDAARGKMAVLPMNNRSMSPDQVQEAEDDDAPQPVPSSAVVNSTKLWEEIAKTALALSKLKPEDFNVTIPPDVISIEKGMENETYIKRFVNVPESSALTLACSTGMPTLAPFADFQWLIGNVSFSLARKATRTRIGSANELIFEEIDVTESGQYSCETTRKNVHYVNIIDVYVYVPADITAVFPFWFQTSRCDRDLELILNNQFQNFFCSASVNCAFRFSTACRVTPWYKQEESNSLPANVQVLAVKFVDPNFKAPNCSAECIMKAKLTNIFSELDALSEAFMRIGASAMAANGNCTAVVCPSNFVFVPETTISAVKIVYVCDAGYVLYRRSACVPCWYGLYSPDRGSNEDCTPCPALTYQPNPASTECFSCPNTTTVAINASVLGATSRDQCPSGAKTGKSLGKSVFYIILIVVLLIFLLCIIIILCCNRKALVGICFKDKRTAASADTPDSPDEKLPLYPAKQTGPVAAPRRSSTASKLKPSKTTASPAAVKAGRPDLPAIVPVKATIVKSAPPSAARRDPSLPTIVPVKATIVKSAPPSSAPGRGPHEPMWPAKGSTPSKPMIASRLPLDQAKTEEPSAPSPPMVRSAVQSRTSLKTSTLQWTPVKAGTAAVALKKSETISPTPMQTAAEASPTATMITSKVATATPASSGFLTQESGTSEPFRPLATSVSAPATTAPMGAAESRVVGPSRFNRSPTPFVREGDASTATSIGEGQSMEDFDRPSAFEPIPRGGVDPSKYWNDPIGPPTEAEGRLAGLSNFNATPKPFVLGEGYGVRGPTTTSSIGGPDKVETFEPPPPPPLSSLPPPLPLSKPPPYMYRPDGMEQALPKSTSFKPFVPIDASTQPEIEPSDWPLAETPVEGDRFVPRLSKTSPSLASGPATDLPSIASSTGGLPTTATSEPLKTLPFDQTPSPDDSRLRSRKSILRNGVPSHSSIAEQDEVVEVPSESRVLASVVPEVSDSVYPEKTQKKGERTSFHTFIDVTEPRSDSRENVRSIPTTSYVAATSSTADQRFFEKLRPRSDVLHPPSKGSRSLTIQSAREGLSDIDVVPKSSAMAALAPVEESPPSQEPLSADSTDLPDRTVRLSVSRQGRALPEPPDGTQDLAQSATVRRFEPAAGELVSASQRPSASRVASSIFRSVSHISVTADATPAEIIMKTFERVAPDLQLRAIRVKVGDEVDYIEIPQDISIMNTQSANSVKRFGPVHENTNIGLKFKFSGSRAGDLPPEPNAIPLRSKSIEASSDRRPAVEGVPDPPSSGPSIARSTALAETEIGEPFSASTEQAPARTRSAGPSGRVGAKIRAYQALTRAGFNEPKRE